MKKNQLTKQVLSFQNCFPKPEMDKLTAVSVVDLKTLIRTILQIPFTFEEMMSYVPKECASEDLVADCYFPGS